MPALRAALARVREEAGIERTTAGRPAGGARRRRRAVGLRPAAVLHALRHTRAGHVHPQRDPLLQMPGVPAQVERDRESSMNLEFHHAAELFPLVTGKEFESLKADIAEHGLRELPWTHEGKIIDGRNRVRACRELGKNFSTREWDGNGSPIEFVVSVNLHRRHLTASQRAMVARDMLPMLKAEAKERQREHGFTAPGKRKNTCSRNGTSVQAGRSVAHAGRLVGVSQGYVSEARAVAEADPKLAEKVRSGVVTLKAARHRSGGKPARKRAPAVKIPRGESAQARRLVAIATEFHELTKRPPLQIPYTRLRKCAVEMKEIVFVLFPDLVRSKS